MEEVLFWKHQAEEANWRYQRLRTECQGALTRIGTLDRDLHAAKLEIAATCKKRDDYKANLKDVIFQYKSLHGEYEEATLKIQSIQKSAMLTEKDMERMQT